MATLQSKTQTRLQTLTPQKIEAVARVLNKRFSTSTPFSRAYLKATVSEIRVSGDLLKLSGENKTIANLVASNGKIDADKQVLGSIPDWRPLIATIRTCYRQDVLNLHKIMPPALG